MEHDENGLEKKPEGFSWNNPGAFGPLIVLAIVALLFAGPAVYVKRYDLGLVEPKWKPGQCIGTATEFGDIRFRYRINKVGKTRYQLQMFDLHDKWISVSRPSDERFEYTENTSIEIKCPDFVEEEYHAL